MSPDRTARLLTQAHRLEACTAGIAAALCGMALGGMVITALVAVLQGFRP
jgi:hypothetical protein